MNIDPPMSAADVPAVAEKVKAKLDHWKSDQQAQTQRVRPLHRQVIIEPAIKFKHRANMYA